MVAASGIKPTFKNISILIASMYPAFIVTFLVVASLFNLKLNGLIYLLGIFLTFIICYPTAMAFDKERYINGIDTCDMFSTFGYPYKNPSFQVATTMFTLVYLLIPMIYSGLFNPVVVVVLSIMTGINACFLYKKGCTSLIGILVGFLIGSGLAGIMVALLMASSNRNLLFYNELVSNNAICTRPKKTKFKCSIYKGGELVSTSIA